MSEFDVNINTGNEQFNIKSKKYPGLLTKNLSIIELKTLIQLQKKLFGKQLTLKYNGNVMKNDDTLKQHGIVNSQHLIEMITFVEASQSYVDNNITNNNSDLHVMTPKEKDAYTNLVSVLKSYQKLVDNIDLFLNDNDFFETNLLKQLNDKYNDLSSIVQNRKKAITVDIKKISSNQNSNDNITKLKQLQQKIKITYKTLKDVKDKIIHIIKQTKINNIRSESSDDDMDNNSDPKSNNDSTNDTDSKDDVKSDEKESESIVDIVNNALNKLDDKPRNKAKLMIGAQYKIIYSSTLFEEYIKSRFAVGIGKPNPFQVCDTIVPGEYKILFQSFSSNGGVDTSSFIIWNQRDLTNCTGSNSIVQHCSGSQSKFKIKSNGLYRIVVRFVDSSSSKHFACLYINGTAYSIHTRYYASGSNGYDVTYSFNEIIELKRGSEIRVYVSSRKQKNEIKSSYFCIEKISPLMIDKIGIWESTKKSNEYYHWNVCKKKCNKYFDASNTPYIKTKNSGFYRINARIHTRFSSNGSKTAYLMSKHHGSTKSLYNYQATSYTSSGFIGHNISGIIYLTKHEKDYFGIYNTQGDIGTSQHQRMSVELIPFPELIGIFNSNSKSNDFVIWDYPDYYNSKLYDITDDFKYIQVKQAGYYRLNISITTSCSSSSAVVSLNVNDNEYSIAKMGCQGGTYYNTIPIFEIVKLNKNDKISIGTSTFYANYKYNVLTIERIPA